MDAFETAMDNLEKGRRLGMGVESLMLWAQDEDIDKAQHQQRMRNVVGQSRQNGRSFGSAHQIRLAWSKPQVTVVQYDVMKEIDQYLSWQKDEAKRAEMAKAVKACAETLNQMGYTFESAVKALGAALNDALRPILDLLDQKEAILRQATCPSHGQPLRGGRCSKCDLRKQNPGRTPGRQRRP